MLCWAPIEEKFLNKLCVMLLRAHILSTPCNAILFKSSNRRQRMRVTCHAERKHLESCKLITALKTPYLIDGKIDLESFDGMILRQISNGVDAVVIGGTTGEGQLMSWDEHVMLIAHTVNKFGNSLLVIGNTGSNSTKEAIHATDQGFSVGMDASLQINPYYGKTSRIGLIKHFQSVLDVGPGIVYNVPARTAQDINPDIMFELCSHDNFVGVKECQGNERIELYSKSGIYCWSGNDDEAHDARWKHGAVGVISVASNLIPGLSFRLMNGNDPQKELDEVLKPLFSWLFCEPNPVSINTALMMTSACKPVFRLPYVPLDIEKRRIGYDLMSTLGMEHILPDNIKSLKMLDDDEFTLLGKY